MNFDQVYEEYADTVYSYLCFRLRDHHLAEDVFQETFMSIYANLDALRAAQSKKAWILTIAHRKMVDRIRKQSSEATPDEIREIHRGYPHPRQASQNNAHLNRIGRTMLRRSGDIIAESGSSCRSIV